MGEDRAGPAGEDCRHPVTFAGERRVSDRVHAPMHAMQAPGGDTTSYGASTQAELEKLDQGDDPVLPSRELGDEPIDWGLWLLRPVFRRNVHDPLIVAAKGSRI